MRVEALELAGLTPKVIDVDAYSMERAYSPTYYSIKLELWLIEY